MSEARRNAPDPELAASDSTGMEASEHAWRDDVPDAVAEFLRGLDRRRAALAERGEPIKSDPWVRRTG